MKKRYSKIFYSLSFIVLLVVAFACTNNSGAKEKPKYTFKEGGAKPGIAIKINDKEYSDEELVGDQKMEFADAMRRVYDLKLSRVGSLLLDHKYGPEAKKANLDLETYLDQKVLKDPKTSDKDVEKFAAEKNIPKEQVGQYKEKIIAYLKAMKKNEEREALIAKLSKQNKIEIYFAKPSLKVDVELGTGAIYGDKNAKVKIIEFSDFQCPYCSRGASVVKELKKAYGKKIAISFRHFPLPMHPQAKPASEAAMCVNEQNADKFWTYHDRLFAQQDKLDPENLKKVAKEVGVNEEQFNTCFDGHKYANLIQQDLEYGSKIGVRSTPTFYVNGRPVQGAQPVEVFKEMIDEELAD